MKIKIRKTETKDAGEIIKLSNLVWRDAYSNIFPEQVFVDRENNNAERIKTRQSRNNFGRINYVATDDEKIVAYMDAQLESQYQHFKDLGCADLCAIYVHPKYQGVGIGKKLFEMFKSDVKKFGITKFVVGVLKDNRKARIVYEKWGGILNDFTQPLIKLNQEYAEVFYTFEI